MRACKVDGCERKVHAKGCCSKHYQRLMLYGSPTSGGTEVGAPMKWLKEHAGYQGDDCLIWPFCRDKSGYAKIQHHGSVITAHRAMCIEANGPPPPNGRFEAAHSCGNGHLGCVNPKHLRWATAAENGRDRVKHGRVPKGTTQWQAKLTLEQVDQIRALKGTDTCANIGARFGVSAMTVSRVQRRESYR